MLCSLLRSRIMRNSLKIYLGIIYLLAVVEFFIFYEGFDILQLSITFGFIFSDKIF